MLKKLWVGGWMCGKKAVLHIVYINKKEICKVFYDALSNNYAQMFS
jgi:hypothetical protein